MRRTLASSAVLAVVTSSLLICGCAAPPPLPSAPMPHGTPGTGAGAAYTPMVDMQGVDSDALATDVGACRTEASNVRVIRLKSERNDVSDVIVISIGMVVPFGLVGMALVSSIVGLSDDGKPRLADDALQQRTLVNCMARKGYRNTDPNVTVAYVARTGLGPESLPPRTGRDTYVAESYAKASNFCLGTAARVALESKGPGYERHSVACGNGRRMALRCEFGNCMPEALEVALGQ